MLGHCNVPESFVHKVLCIPLMVLHQLRHVCQAELATLATLATVHEGALLSPYSFTPYSFPEVVSCSIVQTLGCFLDVTFKNSKLDKTKDIKL